MSKNIFPWVKPLGLSSSNFSNKPENADALIWGLKNNIINADDYIEWATEYYRCPAIRAEFFSMAVDFSLSEKYANLYDWYTYCYPIYQWEGTLFVACLEPPKEPINGKFCFVIAPFHALESAWQKHENARPGMAMATEQLPIIPNTGEQNIKNLEPEMTATEVVSGKNPFAQLNADIEVQDIHATREQTLTPPPLPEPEQVDELEQVDEPVVMETKEPTKVPKEKPKPIDSGLDFGDLKMEMGVEEPKPQAIKSAKKEVDSSPVGDLDFSGMGEIGLAENKHETENQEGGDDESPFQEEDSPQEDDFSVSANEMTHTKADVGLNNLTSATQTMHFQNQTMTGTQGLTQTPPLPFDNLTIQDMALEGEKTKAKPVKEEKTKVSPAAAKTQEVAQSKPQKAPTAPVQNPSSPKVKASDENSIPSLEIFAEYKTDNPAMAPGLEESDLSLEKENRPTNEGIIDDDYTPVPILTKAQKEAQDRRKKEAIASEKMKEQSRITENTITDHAQPILIPADNLISDEDLRAALNLDNARSMKDVIAHIFGHLRRDYSKLMWVELGNDHQYFVKYVHGDWKITELAWKLHINISNPNIFRVAHKSGHPFHGEVQSNPYNDKYFEWWTRGKTPNIATIYPVSINETIIGFISCFGMNGEFDEIGSLKKIENLVTICRKALANHGSAKAA